MSMNAIRKSLLLTICVCGVVGIGVIFYALINRVASHQTGNTIPGLSNPGVTPCQDFLTEAQPGIVVITPQAGKISEQDVRTYVSVLHSSDPQPVTVNFIKYFDCKQRTFYYAALAGAFYPESYPAGAKLNPSSHQYLLFDAKTGALLRTSIGN